MSSLQSRLVALLALFLCACSGGGSSGSGLAIPPIAPTPPPTSGRFIDFVFPDVDVLPNVQFGTAMTAAGPQNLLMDIRSPRGDTATNRPVLILAFGGAFVAGNRNDVLAVKLANEYARRGYVTASIDYRLLPTGNPTAIEAVIAAFEGMHDMKAAVRFFREDATNTNLLGTRGDRIFVGGVSAGGIIASMCGSIDANDNLPAFVQNFLALNGGVEGLSSSNLNISSQVQGVLSVSGGVSDVNWIDSNSAPIYAAHEEFDPIVPCRFAFGFFGVAYAGGCDMVNQATTMNVPAELFLVNGAFTHLSFTTAQTDTFSHNSALFLAAR